MQKEDFEWKIKARVASENHDEINQLRWLKQECLIPHHSPVIELLDAHCLSTNEKVKNKRIRERTEKANKHIKNDTNRRQRALISSSTPVKRIYEAML